MSEQHKQAALARGKVRSDRVTKSVEQAMIDIAKEMKDNEGIYPQNGGAISKNEVARRAGINLTTLFSEKHKTLSESVSAWLADLKKKEVVGRERVRRTYADRAEDWKALYEALMNVNLECELELQRALAERDEARIETTKLQKAIDAIKEANDALIQQLSLTTGSKIKSITKKKAV